MRPQDYGKCTHLYRVLKGTNQRLEDDNEFFQGHLDPQEALKRADWDMGYVWLVVHGVCINSGVEYKGAASDSWHEREE